MRYSRLWPIWKNEPRWHTDILEAERLTEGEVGEGTSYRVRFRSQPMSPPEGTVEIVTFEPDRRIVSRSDMGNMKPELTHVFERRMEGHKSHAESRSKRVGS
jgi:hypothetical protein